MRKMRTWQLVFMTLSDNLFYLVALCLCDPRFFRKLRCSDLLTVSTERIHSFRKEEEHLGSRRNISFEYNMSLDCTGFSLCSRVLQLLI